MEVRLNQTSDKFSTMFMDNPWFTRWLPMFLFGAVVLHYFWFVYGHAVNIPYQDDIYDVLLAVQRADAADSIGGVIRELNLQYNEHRTGASRVQMYLAYLLQGEVNFHTLALLGNVALALILFLFYLIVREENLRWVFLLVAALLLLHLRAYRIAFWGQAAFAYFYPYFYTLAGLFALHRVTPATFGLAAVFCSLASFTFASGQIAWAFGLASLLHQSLVTRSRSLLYPAMWVLAAFAMLLVWRIGYVPVSSSFSPEELTQMRASHPEYLVGAPLGELLPRYVSFVGLVLGSAFIESNVWIAYGFASLLCITLLYCTWRFYKDEDIRLLLCCWFAVATVAAAGVGRAAIAEPARMLALNDRYGFFSVILVCSLAMLVQQKFKVFRTPAVYLLVAFSIIYSSWTYRQFQQPLADLRQAKYISFNRHIYQVFGYPARESAAIVKAAIEAGRYNPPCRPLPECESSK